MCGRFYVEHDAAAIFPDALISRLNRSGGAAITGSDVHPTDMAAVIANNKRRVLTAFAMRWGYRLDSGRMLINVRSETAAQKAMFAEDLRVHRCIVPVSGYYEWRQVGRERMKYAIHPENSEPAYMAGIYRMEHQQPVFAVLTREPAANIAHIHHRMPVLLNQHDAMQWLDLSRDAAGLLVQSGVRVDSRLLEGTEPMPELFLADEAEGVPVQREE